MNVQRLNSNNIATIEMILFLTAICFQNFGVIIVGDSFGISLLLFVCMYLDLKYKFSINFIKDIFSSLKMYKYMYLIAILVIAKLGFDYATNTTSIVSIVRLLILFYVMYVTFKYTKLQSLDEKNKKLFYKIYLYIAIILSIYGLYCYIGSKFNLPWFLNLLNNNPSYGAKRGLYDYYGGGWVPNPRIFATFAEPSFYSVYLCMSLVFINIEKEYISLRLKLGVSCLLLVNLGLTFARSGYLVLIYIFMIYAIYYMFIEKNIFKIKDNIKDILYKILTGIVIIIPFLNLLAMIFAERYVFNDLSSSARTNSALYYLTESFESIKTFLIGHGYKANFANYSSSLAEKHIEVMAHNGYIQFIYEFGWILFILTIVATVMYISKIRDKKVRILVLVSVLSINSFASFYYVETFLALMTVLVINSMSMSKDDTK